VFASTGRKLTPHHICAAAGLPTISHDRGVRPEGLRLPKGRYA